MKKTLKLIAAMLVLVMTFAMVPAFTVSANTDSSADANTVLVGEGQTYELISAAITGLGTDIVGKTIKLTSDIAEPSSIGVFNTATYGKLTIDGDGHTITLKSALIAKTTTNGQFAEITVKNCKFTQTAKNHPLVYARVNSDITFIDCYTDNTFDYVFALHTDGNGNITIESGYYEAAQKIFNVDMYNNTSKTKSTVVVNGGTFVANGGNIASVSANTELDINGGTFVTTTKAPMIVDTKVSPGSGTASMANISVSGASFVVPVDYTSIFAETTGTDLVTVNMTADNTNKVYAVLPVTAEGTSYYGGNYTSGTGFPTYADKQKTIAAVDDGLTPVTEITDAFATAYLANGTKLAVNADIIVAMNNSMFNGTTIVLTADTNVTVDLANAMVRIIKNGKNAPNLTSSNANSLVIEAFTTNFKNGTTGIQTKTNADGTVSARVIVPIASLNYSKAGVVWTKGEATDNLKYNNLGKYAEGVAAVETTDAYTSFIGDGMTYEAAQCGGNALVILTIDGLAAGDTISFKAYGITAAGAEYTEARTYTIPAAQ